MSIKAIEHLDEYIIYSLNKHDAMRDRWSAVTTFVANTADTSEATNAPTDSPRQ
jgi:hypothetical protein